MSTSTFLPTDMSLVDQNPNNFNHNCTYMSTDHHNYADDDDDDDDDNEYLVPEFDLSEYLAFLDQQDHNEYSSSSFAPSAVSQSPPPVSQEMTTSTTGHVQSSLNPLPVMDGWKRSGKMKGELRVAFRMKTEHEIVDDGYKWRKYGKKKVKTSPNPRNYYKCSNGGGCSVKKRVERDGEDSSYVITTYDGVHNHESPCSSIYGLRPQL